MRCRGALLFVIAGLLAVATPAYAQGTFEQGLDAYLKGDYGKALELWRPAAESGDPVAAFNIGVLYAQGLGVEADPVESVRWYRQSAIAGYSNAQFNLGAAYHNGDGTEANIGQAVAWWEKAAQQDHPEALYNLGALYRRGEGVARNLEQATALFEKAANLGDTRAEQALENLRSTRSEVREPAAGPETEQPVQAPTEQRKPGTIGREDPQRWTVQVFASVERQTAERFARDHGLTDELRIYKAEVDGKNWFKGIYGSYADQGAARAAKTELEKRLPGSSPWVRRFGAIQAEAVEEVAAPSAMGSSEHVETEENQSAKVETGENQSAKVETGEPRSAAPLEQITSDTQEAAASGEGDSKSEPETPATSDDNQPASKPKNEGKTAAVTPSGRDTALRKGQKAFNKQDYGKAFEAWRPLAEAGVSEAQYGIGFMYESGWGVERDYEQAFRWYQLAAQQGHIKAQFNLGMLYRNGQGVSQNDALGLYWIQTAADRGDERALSYLKSLD